MDRFHQGEVLVTRMINLPGLFFELFPFVVFHTWIFSGAYLSNYISYDNETLWVDRSHQREIQCIKTLTLLGLFLSYFPWLFFVLGSCPEHISKSITAMILKRSS